MTKKKKTPSKLNTTKFSGEWLERYSNNNTVHVGQEFEIFIYGVFMCELVCE